MPGLFQGIRKSAQCVWPLALPVSAPAEVPWQNLGHLEGSLRPPNGGEAPNAVPWSGRSHSGGFCRLGCWDPRGGSSLGCTWGLLCVCLKVDF